LTNVEIFNGCLLFAQSLSAHTSSVEAVEFDTAEVLVLAGSSNGSIKLWDLEEAKGVVGT
jgi:WD40 repeat protein